jgi:hypothetical protein
MPVNTPGPGSGLPGRRARRRVAGVLSSQTGVRPGPSELSPGLGFNCTVTVFKFLGPGA